MGDRDVVVCVGKQFPADKGEEGACLISLSAAVCESHSLLMTHNAAAAAAAVCL